MKIRELTESEVAFTVRAEPEDETSPRGHFASDEPELDKRMEDEIVRRYESGDVWAWCTVFVTASWKGVGETVSLGCCSYDSEADFVGTEGGYYGDMRKEALGSLNKRIASEFERIRGLIAA